MSKIARTGSELLDWLFANAKRDTETGCLISHLTPNAKGYIYVTLGGQRLRANRFVFEQVSGEKLGDLFARHGCDNRACIEFNHLQKGTALANSQDMIARDRVARIGQPPTDIAKLQEAIAMQRSGFSLETIAKVQGLSGKSSAADRIRRAKECNL